MNCCFKCYQVMSVFMIYRCSSKPVINFEYVMVWSWIYTFTQTDTLIITFKTFHVSIRYIILVSTCLGLAIMWANKLRLVKSKLHNI